MATKKQRSKKGGEPPVPSRQASKGKKKGQGPQGLGWWQNQLEKGVCHYCGLTFAKKDLTMDHIVPVSRGGKSTKGNVVVACKPCNSDKKYYTAAELILKNQMDSKINSNRVPA